MESMTMTEEATSPAENNADDSVHLSPIGVPEIMTLIPHRYPFLLVDRVTEHVQGKHIKGYKNVSINEPYFQGHFPNDPIMPGVLQLEAMAQLGGVMMMSTEVAKGKLMVFAGMNNVRFRRMVVPGDRLEMEVELTRLRPPIGKSHCKAYVNGELAVEAEMVFSMVSRDAVNRAQD
jgi:3-hydroxyacyl-[acyl-carrier-protein] dehydratase